MTAHSELMVQPLPCEFHNLWAYVAGPDARAQTAYTMELTWWRRLLALGAMLLRRFLGVVNLLVLISSGGNTGTRAEQL